MTTDDPTTDGSDSAKLPSDIVDEAERLTRLARDAVDDNEAEAYLEKRADILAGRDFTARVREDDRDTLVLYPEEWVEDGTVYPDRIEDIDRGVERPLEGPGSSEDWETVASYNREIAETVEARHGDVHGRNAHALADFASNHYAKPISDLTRKERAEFLGEYFPRNAFPDDDQKEVVEESIELALEATDDNADAVTGGER